jgi:glutathione S-transferase
MLELKGVAYESTEVLPGTQRIHLRAAGFRGGTVPALKLDGRRVQGSREIARALDQLRPAPALFPTEPALRTRVEDAERWGEQELQAAPRILFRWGLVHDMDLRRWFARESNMPFSALAARTSGPVSRYYARLVDADDDGVRRVLDRLPDMLAHADALLEDGTLAVEPPNAAALQILSSVRALDAFSDLHELVASHRVLPAARALFPDYPEPIPHFLPPAWLGALARPG